MNQSPRTQALPRQYADVFAFLGALGVFGGQIS
jgi:hypothetical protein